jgi:hypothetical protein
LKDFKDYAILLILFALVFGYFKLNPSKSTNNSMTRAEQELFIKETIRNELAKVAKEVVERNEDQEFEVKGAEEKLVNDSNLYIKLPPVLGADIKGYYCSEDLTLIVELEPKTEDLKAGNYAIYSSVLPDTKEELTFKKILKNPTSTGSYNIDNRKINLDVKTGAKEMFEGNTKYFFTWSGVKFLESINIIGGVENRYCKLVNPKI